MVGPIAQVRVGSSGRAQSRGALNPFTTAGQPLLCVARRGKVYGARRPPDAPADGLQLRKKLRGLEALLTESRLIALQGPAGPRAAAQREAAWLPSKNWRSRSVLGAPVSPHQVGEGT